VLDTIKQLAFRYATQAGITVSKNDIVIPPSKEEILAGYEAQVAKLELEYQRGLMTEEERHERIVAVWTEATEEVAQAMKDNLHQTNSIFMMANSGARGSFNQIRQLAGMRGLMANPKGEIIERPIKANFMEGLSVLEYFISTHGARKGLADTALRTADSGYLTRRLVDVSQDVIIRDLDCGTDEYVELEAVLDGKLNSSVAGRILAVDVHKPLKDGKPGKTLILEAGADLTIPVLEKLLEDLEEHAEGYRVPVRSVLKCKSEHGVCRACYGTFLATGYTAEVGDAVGIIACTVDRRAGHAAHDADVPHRRRRRGGHHPRPSARRRDLRGAEPEGRRDGLGGPRQGRDRGRRPHDQGDGRPVRAR
jgi:DNA-directed RNA polymerase subunit beta'